MKIKLVKTLMIVGCMSLVSCGGSSDGDDTGSTVILPKNTTAVTLSEAELCFESLGVDTPSNGDEGRAIIAIIEDLIDAGTLPQTCQDAIDSGAIVLPEDGGTVADDTENVAF